jgi:hypothetical protein
VGCQRQTEWKEEAMSSIDCRGDVVVLNECGGCVAGEVRDREIR